MKVCAVKTRVVQAFSSSITEILDEALSSVPENSIIAITSKIISLCEGNVVPIKPEIKDEIIQDEADYFLPRSSSKYNICLTVKSSLLLPSAGVDESNTNGYYVMWPKDPLESANSCWRFIKEKFNLKNVGVIVTDSTSSPLRWGVIGRCIAYCGFKALNNKVGEPDLFGRKMQMTKIGVADALAASAVLCMGESNEQTPIAVINDIPFVEFVQDPPSKEEVEEMHIEIEDDLFCNLLTSADWQSKHNKSFKK